MKLSIDRSRIPILATLVAFVLLFLAASLRYPGFFSLWVIINLLGDNAFLGIIAVGMTFVIISGGIDLSVGALMALSSILLAVFIEVLGLPPCVAVAAVILIGALFGFASGTLIHFLALPAFLVTLVGMFLARGLALVVHIEAMAIHHPLYDTLTAAAVPLGGGLRIPITAVTFLAVVAAGTWALGHTRFGRNVYAVGGNEEAALLLGVAVARTKVGVYTLSGFCSALAGVIYTLYNSAGDSSAGIALELDAIAAVVVGGALLTGGVGSAIGTLMGVLIFGTIQTILNFEGTLNAGWTRVAIGGLLLVFITLQRFLLRKS